MHAHMSANMHMCECQNACAYSQKKMLIIYNKRKKIITVKILKFGTPQTIAIIVLKIEKFDVTLH